METSSFVAAGAGRQVVVRDGAPAIGLVDGETLAQLLKEQRIDVAVRMVDEICPDLDAFNEF